MDLVCDDNNDLAESIAKIIKRLNRSNGNRSRSRDLGSVSTSVRTPRRNTSAMEILIHDQEIDLVEKIVQNPM